MPQARLWNNELKFTSRTSSALLLRTDNGDLSTSALYTAWIGDKESSVGNSIVVL